MTDPNDQRASRISLSGTVQGVGFRPFIYQHAIAHGLAGWVLNSSGRVEIHIQGRSRALESFITSLIDSSPPLSRPVIEMITDVTSIETSEFVILESQSSAAADIHLPADLFTCDDCLHELNDPGNRRYRYPFINCTQCGPRYTLIEALPYDRPNTSMAGFPLCKACLSEYTDPNNRRYHAEPVACEMCGPSLSYHEAGQRAIEGNEASLTATISALRAGEIVAIKGIGGYHLVCDASSDIAVNILRNHKPRPHKPLAVMFPAPADDPLQRIRQYLLPEPVEAELLTSTARPIVLVQKKPGNTLSPAIAPGLNEIGAMLPYSPLHHLLLSGFNAPLVATSANISGEPVLTKNRDIEQRLSHVARVFLHHDRPIVRPADDPVLRVIDGIPRPVRQGRGMAPVEIELPFELDSPVLAVGSHMKNTVALGWQNRVVVSPHIGEMDSPRSLATFAQCIEDLQSLYQVTATHVVCDAHPGYTPSRWARQGKLPVTDVYHHHAHASAAYMETMQKSARAQNMLVFTWDGVGLGPDDSLWGGEALFGKPGQWQRLASLRPFRLPGGERAGREPWRSAAAICWESGQDCLLDEASDPLLFSFWQQGKNSPATTAAGRLFDAAAALCGVCTTASFEGQGPMLLEALADSHECMTDMQSKAMDCTPVDGIYTADWETLIPILSDHSRPAGERALHFHQVMARTLLAQAVQIREDTGVNAIGLCGGVFQNRVLTELCMDYLAAEKFHVSLPILTPVNDGGISFGQIIEYAHLNNLVEKN